MEKKNLAEVEVLGHKASIWLGRSVVADGIWRKEDCIVVHIDFGEKPVGGTISFGIELPAKHYSREEFLKAVEEEGSDRLAGIIAKDREQQDKHEIKKARQEALDSLAKGIESMF